MEAGQQGQPRVAIVGAGLAGLSAAYFLRNKATVTIFEKDNRVGGRILTSSRPPGEHGAEFLLESDTALVRLMDNLGIEKEPAGERWPSYLLRRNLTSGSLEQAARDLLPEESAEQVDKLLKLVLSQDKWPNHSFNMAKWMGEFLQGDLEAVSFIEMLLKGETCAPLNHITTDYGLGCLGSVLDDEWYCIRGGTVRLTEALRRNSGAAVRTSVEVIRLKETRQGVAVRYKTSGGPKSEIFHGAIIATPDGEHLLGHKVRGHFHSYLSVLLEFQARPRIWGSHSLDLADGLYTDGPLNYLQLLANADSRNVMRILIPNARLSRFGRSDDDIVNFCVQHLDRILVHVPPLGAASAKYWKMGFPCGGIDAHFLKIGSRICLAGDQFGKWPSMEAAINSGRRAGDALAASLHQISIQGR